MIRRTPFHCSFKNPLLSCNKTACKPKVRLAAVLLQELRNRSLLDRTMFVLNCNPHFEESFHSVLEQNYSLVFFKLMFKLLSD